MSDKYRTAYIYVRNVFAGVLAETDYGYSFAYDEEYLQSENATARIANSSWVKPNAFLFCFINSLITFIAPPQKTYNI